MTLLDKHPRMKYVGHTPTVVYIFRMITGRTSCMIQGSISSAGVGRECEWAEEGDWGPAEGTGIRQGGGSQGPGGGQAGC